MTMTNQYDKPVPIPENPAPTRPYWDAAKRHELVQPRCKRCNDFFWYPREQCPNCFSQDIEWVTVSGKGKVYAYTIVYQTGHPAFQEGAPHVLAAIDLEEGTRLISNVIGCPVEEVKIDMPVTVVFDDVTPEWTLPKFKPA
jgi:hypothetical protein|tara:strand:+ start:97 stop:519 length:423 start_codon:yes stop_codon:yes gene_type:complete